MSRHQIPGIDPKHEVFVGWDPPLMSFFGQVYDPSLDEEENPTFWVGAGRLRELQTVGHLVLAMTSYVVFSDAVLTMLNDDRRFDRA